MTIISQNNENNQECANRILAFFKTFEVEKLLHRCNAAKQKGFTVIEIFRYLLCLMFSDRSMYMQMKTNRYTEDFSKNTVHRFLDNGKINWEKFTNMLSECIVNSFMRPLTSDAREDVFIVDDSAYKKTGYKKTELVATVFDHVSMKYIKGFRMLTLGWSDGNSFVPISHRLMSSGNDKNVIGVVEDYDKRSLSYKRRYQARQKATDVMIDMVKQAKKCGHYAKYVLFDTWFSCPCIVAALKTECKLDTIAMVKKNQNIRYCYNGEMLDIKTIYSRCKKRPGRSKYLLSVVVDVVSIDENGCKITVPAKIVCVRNRSKKKEWLAIICTNTELSEMEIIRIYGKRWDIEVFFKSCKSMLKLEQCRKLSYGALTAYVSIVFVRYMFLSYEKSNNEDDRTLGELMFFIYDEMQDITFSHSMVIITQALFDAVTEMLNLTKEQLEALAERFLSRLPEYLRNSLIITVK